MLQKIHKNAYKYIKNAIFSNIQESIFPRECNICFNGFGGVEHMYWSPLEPNIYPWYLKTTKPPCLLSISWFCFIFKLLFTKHEHLVNKKVNKCWPKFSYRNKLTKLNKKHIYTFFIARILFSKIQFFEFFTYLTLLKV